MVRSEDKILLQVNHLKKYFPLKKQLGQEQRFVKAVDDVSFSIRKGEAMGLVGESGCGKSTLIRTIMQLIEPTSGDVFFEGERLNGMDPRMLKEMRRHMQIVFQDPFASLHPKMKIGQILEEPLIINGYRDVAERRHKISQIIEQVGLSQGHLNRYPHEFSGGQRQRIVIARALVLNPSLLILDEPVSALDVSVRSQILNLLEELRRERNLTYLFISHDLSVVEHLCDFVMVMYLGHVMEKGSREQIFQNPQHPYTQALLSAILTVNPDDRREKIVLQGEIPSPVNPPVGCPLKTRCQYCRDMCSQSPVEVEVEPGHFVACNRMGAWNEQEKGGA